jgi:hypothetical protein
VPEPERRVRGSQVQPEQKGQQTGQEQMGQQAWRQQLSKVSKVPVKV